MIDQDKHQLDIAERWNQIERLGAELRARFPYQFPPTLPTMMVSPEPGWQSLLESLCHDVDRLLPETLRDQFRWTQIKEKFGTLRAYWSFGPLYFDIQGADGLVSGTLPQPRPDAYESIWKAIDERITEAEQQSARVCGECGAAGSLRRGSWYRTLCDRHAQAQEDGR